MEAETNEVGWGGRGWQIEGAGGWKERDQCFVNLVVQIACHLILGPLSQTAERGRVAWVYLKSLMWPTQLQ